MDYHKLWLFWTWQHRKQLLNVQQQNYYVMKLETPRDTHRTSINTHSPDCIDVITAMKMWPQGAQWVLWSSIQTSCCRQSCSTKISYGVQPKFILYCFIRAGGTILLVGQTGFMLMGMNFMNPSFSTSCSKTFWVIMKLAHITPLPNGSEYIICKCDANEYSYVNQFFKSSL